MSRPLGQFAETIWHVHISETEGSAVEQAKITGKNVPNGELANLCSKIKHNSHL